MFMPVGVCVWVWVCLGVRHTLACVRETLARVGYTLAWVRFLVHADAIFSSHAHIFPHICTVGKDDEQ